MNKHLGYDSKGSVMFKYSDTWTLEIYKNHAIAAHRGQMYLHHTLTTVSRNGTWKCDLGGRWVHGTDDNHCNCGVKYPDTLWSRIKILDWIRKRTITELRSI